MCCLREPEWSDDENIEGPDLTKEVLKVLEPDAGKLARPVLRGGSHGNVTFLPDNLIAEETPARHVQYRYDALGRLTSLTCNGQVTHYQYDSFNRRLKKSSDQGEERYLYVDQNEIGQVDSYGKIVQLRVLGQGKGAEIGSAVALELDGKVYIPIHDHSGHVSVLVDPENQTLAEGYTYTAFGEELRYGPGTTNPWHFSSKRYDPESGWIYFGRRYYDPITGRWTTPDPIGFTDGPNLYAYVKNNPLTHFDLYGLLLCTDFHSPETLCSRRSISSPLNSTRIFGALQAFGGLTEAGLGGGLSMASQGALVPLGMAIIAHGVDQYTAGMSTLFSGKPQSTLSAQGLQKCGLSAGHSHAVDNTLSMVATLGANAYLQTLRQATPLLGKNASAITYQKANLSPAVEEVKTTKNFKPFTKSNYRHNLIEFTGVDPGKSADAHHVFPQHLRNDFLKKNINIDDPQYLTWWHTKVNSPTNTHQMKAWEYGQKWARFMEKEFETASKEEILEFGRKTMAEFEFQVNY